MRVTVQDANGVELYSYDTTKSSECLCPARDATPEVVQALDEAADFLVARALPPRLIRQQSNW